MAFTVLDSGVINPAFLSLIETFSYTYFAAGNISVGFTPRTCVCVESVYLVALLIFAQRAVWAAAILARASGETLLFLKGAAPVLPAPL